MPFDPTTVAQSMYLAPNNNQQLVYNPSEAPTFDPNNYVPTTSTQMMYESTGTPQMTFEPSQTSSEPNSYPPMTFNPTGAPPPAQSYWTQPVEGGGLTLGQGHQEPVESHDSQGSKEVNKEKEKETEETKGKAVKFDLQLSL